jgi:ankyrin repeat protein
MNEQEIQEFRDQMQDLLDRFENNPTQEEVLGFLEEINQLSYSQPDIIQEILDIRERSTGNSILHYAVRENYQTVVIKLLDELGMHLAIENNDGQTPLNLSTEMTNQLLRDAHQDIKGDTKRGGHTKGGKQNRSKKKISRKRRKNKRNKRRTFRYFL